MMSIKIRFSVYLPPFPLPARTKNVPFFLDNLSAKL